MGSAKQLPCQHGKE